MPRRVLSATIALSLGLAALAGAAEPAKGGKSAVQKSDYLFPGGKAGKPLSNMAMTEVLRRMGRGDITVHGFRSTFRDWAAERTNFPNEVVEMALAHAVGDKVEAAYRRGDLFEKHRRLMADWAAYCERQAASGRDKVVPMRRSR